MEKVLFMAQLDTVTAPDTLRTTLGSCIGIVIYNERTGLYGVSHIMLPTAPGPGRNVGKYADTAIPKLLEMLREKGSNSSSLVAKIAGGSNMFSAIESATIPIGNQNIEAVKRILAELKIKIIAEDLGGTTGRKLLVDPSSKKIFISKIGEQPVEL